MSPARLSVVYAAGTAAGFALSLTPIPMPWLIGPMLVSAAAGIGIGRLRPPAAARPVGQLVVATVVGMAFTATALAAFLDHIVAMLVVAFATILFGLAAAAVLVRLARVDAISATIACVPGGPVEMSAFAETYGVPPAPVAFVQTLRIALLVVTIPSLLVAISGGAGDAGAALSGGGHGLVESLPLLVAAAAGGFVFCALRLASPFFLGPLAVGAAASSLSLPMAMAPPYWLLCSAQVLLGVSLGSMFERRLFTEMRGFLLAACASTAVLVILSALLALAISATTGIPWQTMVLATAPGSVTEMSLTARLLHLDAPLVTAFHLVRIFIIIPLAPLIFAATTASLRRGLPACRPAATPNRDGPDE